VDRRRTSMKKSLIIITLIILSISVVAIPLYSGCFGLMSQGRGYRGPGMMHFGFGGISMWILLLVIIGLVVYLVVRNQKKVSSGEHHEGVTPLDIVKKRYARGEISKEEFEQLKKDLL
jgi:putative membrane protein